MVTSLLLLVICIMGGIWLHTFLHQQGSMNRGGKICPLCRVANTLAIGLSSPEESGRRVRKLIEEGALLLALDNVLMQAKALGNKEICNQLLLQKARIAETKKDWRNGLISYDTYRVILNREYLCLLSIVDIVLPTW